MKDEELVTRYQRRMFFRPPEDPYDRLEKGGSMDVHVGTLYLLRREMIETAFDVDEIVSEESLRARPIERRAFASAILVFTGIDLLAKFAAGDDAIGKLGERFRAFCDQYMKLHPDDAAIAWEARNALTHAFGLGSIKGMPFAIQVDFGKDVVTKQPGYFVLSVSSLYWRFIEAVHEFERRLRSEPELQKNFAQIFPTYGVQGILPGGMDATSTKS